MKITEASISDIPALVTLVNSAYRGDSSRQGWTTEADLLDGIRIDEPTLQQFFRDTNSTILKTINKDMQMTGCVYLKKQGEELYLGMLTVSPEIQGQGIGKLMLQVAENKARKTGCKSIAMTVISTRGELLDWYERHGYKKTGQTQPFPQDERFGIPKEPLEFVVLKKIL